MGNIDVSIDINASPPVVWGVIEQIEDHVDWMSDALAIRFLTKRTHGRGTEFLCDTKIGPIKVTDRMEITDWTPWPDVIEDHTYIAKMGVKHTGLVTGNGIFILKAHDGGARTRFSWTEQLRFPWFLGGRFGAALGGRFVLTPIWRRNLLALRHIVESG